MYRVITVAREYGSGGGRIAERLASRLGWQLIDNSLITQVAKAAHVDPEICHECDEHVDSWFHRLNKQTFGLGAFEAIASGDVFDADAMVALTRTFIREAAQEGNAVIVGRGAQCVLQGRQDVLHTFIFAPMDERIRRIRERFGSGFATPGRILEKDRERAAYVRYYYSCDWRDPHLYDVLFCSLMGEETIVGMMLRAIGIEEAKPLDAG
jgi:cytidylate kinase